MTEITEVASGFAFTEGPCIDGDGILYVVELSNHLVSRVIDGKREIFAHLGGSPNGAAFGPDGDLYVTNGGNNWGPNVASRGIAGWGGAGSYVQRVDKDGWSRVILDEVDGRKLNSPSDLCVEADGGIYFTDPVWPERFEDGSPDASTVTGGDIWYIAPGGEATHCHTGLLFPNGVVVTPDRSALMVAETAGCKVWRFPILSPGVVGEPEVYVDLGEGTWPDGMCWDTRGRLLVAGFVSHKVYAVAPGGGSIEREIEFDDHVTNMCFGGEDMKTVFVTLPATGRVVSIEWDVPGLPALPR